jgi:hypothetical protein
MGEIDRQLEQKIIVALTNLDGAVHGILNRGTEGLILYILARGNFIPTISQYKKLQRVFVP